MDRKSGLLLIFSTAIISGVSIFLNKYGVSGIDSDIFTFAKSLVNTIFFITLLIFMSQYRDFAKLKFKDWIKLAAVGLVGGSLPFLLFFRGLQLTTSASASLIHKSMFIYVAVFAVFFLKEKLNRKVLIAMLLLALGNYLMLRPTWSFNHGDLLVACATLLWAVENTISKHLLKNLSANLVVLGRMFFGSAILFAYLLFVGKESLLTNLSVNQIVWVLISAGMLILYQLTWYNGLKTIDVSVATAILLLGSPITTLLNFFTGTSVTIHQAIGSFLIVAGIVTFIVSAGYIRLDKGSWLKRIQA